MSWDYRVISVDYGDDVEYGIHEVFYTGDTPVAYTEEPVPVVGNTLEELAFTLEYMKQALEKDVLTDEVFNV
jgi:hypothetical protein